MCVITKSVQPALGRTQVACERSADFAHFRVLSLTCQLRDTLHRQLEAKPDALAWFLEDMAQMYARVRPGTLPVGCLLFVLQECLISLVVVPLVDSSQLR